MNIFIAQKGQRLGPFTVTELTEKVLQGEASLDDLAWHEGCADWKAIAEMPGLLDAVMPSMVSSAPAGGTLTDEAGSKRFEDRDWYYLVDAKPVGPITQMELAQLAKAETIKDETFVCREGMANWEKYGCLRKPTTALARRSALEGSILKPVERSTPNPCKLFVPWPCSVVGSVITGLWVIWFGAGTLAHLTGFIFLKDGSEVFGILVNLGLCFLGYLFFMSLRYVLVIAPYRRELRKAGCAKAPKVYTYDYLMNNSRAFIFTGIMAGLGMGVLIWENSLAIGDSRSSIESSRQHVSSLQYDVKESSKDVVAEAYRNTTDEQLRAEYERDIKLGIPADQAQSGYEQSKRQLEAFRAADAQSNNRIVNEAANALGTATINAITIKMYKFLNGVYGCLAIGCWAFAGWVWRSKVKDAHLTLGVRTQAV
jgi:hypothetical protein